MSFKKGLFKNVLISGGFNYLSQGINFLSTIIVSRILSPENYGLVGLITVFTNFILVFSDGGLSYALIRSDYGRTYQRVLNNLSWLLGITLFLITIILAYPISVFYNNAALFWPTIVLAFTFLLRSLSLVNGAILAKDLRFALIGKVNLLGMIISVCLTIILAFLGAGYWALVFPQIVNAIVMAIAYEHEVKLGYKIYPLNYIKVGFKHTKKLVASVIGFNAINYWSRNSDNMIVGRLYGATDLGLYTRAYSLLTLPLVLISSLFANILFPSLKKLQREGGNIEQEYYFVLKVITFLSFPLVFLLIALPNQLVMLLWGIKWIKVAQFLPYFGLLIYTQTVLSTVGQLLILQGKEREYMISGWVAAFFLVGGIVFGATISLVAVAQYYALSFLVAVLIFNVIYIYIKTLNFKVRGVIIFWVPKILLSILLWFTIFFDLHAIKVSTLTVMFCSILLENRNEIIKIMFVVKSKYVSLINE